ncbi:MAG TPA: hypothetical protein VJ866_22030 [Pyrinomonadaceae bacterium]|nr:hypothetical protein [Pyrinomonadaceae bacterium]
MPALLVAAALVGSGCAALTASRESSFFRGFSLQKSVEKNASRSGLDCSGGGGGGGGIGSSGGGFGFGGREYHSHKGEGFSCRLAGGGESFDEQGFISALRREVEAAITASGAKIVDGGGQSAGGFSYEYASGDVRGRVKVTGRRRAGVYYSVEADLEESGGKGAR